MTKPTTEPRLDRKRFAMIAITLTVLSMAAVATVPYTASAWAAWAGLLIAILAVAWDSAKPRTAASAQG